METTKISQLEDTIDSRDIIARIEELQEMEAEWFDEDDEAELRTLLALQEEASKSPDWVYGETLILDEFFPEYTQELVEDCYDLPETWPFRCIDWEQAARELKRDYYPVSYGESTYWIRS